MNDLSPKKESSLFSDNSSEGRLIKDKNSKSNSPIAKDYHFSRSRSQSIDKKEEKDKVFIIKNGCCRECMRAFSKNGKSCLCQVPKRERKYTLADKGCNYCGCKGCNPIDVKKEKRRELKNQLLNDKNIMYKKQRIVDSDDEDMLIHLKEPDEYNKLRRDLEYYLETFFKYPTFCGMGLPKRHMSYILGYNPTLSQGNDKKKQNYRDRERDRERENKESKYSPKKDSPQRRHSS